MNHIIFLTSDGEWKAKENELEGMLLWLPTIPLEHMDNQHKKDVINDQMKQMIPILTNQWQGK